jgi:hypothetical protein
MKFRSGLLVGLGAGYVLGAKAGRERYQQIVEATRALMDNPGVQRLTDELGKTVNVGKDRVSSVTSRKVEQVSSTLADQTSKAKSYVAGESKPGESKADEESKPAAKTSASKPSSPTDSGEQSTAQTTSTTASRSGRSS